MVFWQKNVFDVITIKAGRTISFAQKSHDKCIGNWASLKKFSFEMKREQGIVIPLGHMT